MRAICISLPERPERIERARAHFADRGLTDVEFLYGINGPVAGLATWHMYEVHNPGGGFRIGPKPTGCWLSHYMAWSCVTIMPDDACLILEDDAELDVDFMDKFAQAMRDVPSDYAIFHLGSCCLGSADKRHVAGSVHECKAQECLHAYVLRRSGAEYLVRTMRKCWGPVDSQLVVECYPHMRTYAVVPRIAAQFDTVIPP